MDAAFEHFLAEGYCVIPNVLTQDECAKAKDGFWDFFRALNPVVDKNNEQTYQRKNLPFMLHGIIQHYRVGHWPFVWDLRQNPAVVSAFAALWSRMRKEDVKPEDLLVSFDGVGFMLHPRNGDREAATKPWPHTDQRSTAKGFQCAQGFLNLEECHGPTDGCLVVWPKSHLLHSQYFRDHGLVCKEDWFKLPDRDASWFEARGCVRTRVSAPAGSLVLWDSRTIHQNTPPTAQSTRDRYVVYVCMMPRDLSSEKDLEKKRKCFEEGRMTTHWAQKPKMFSMSPRDNYLGGLLSCKPKQAPVPSPVLTSLGRRLAGFGHPKKVFKVGL